MEKMKELKNKFMEKFYLEGGLNQIWEWVEQELNKAREEGRESVIAELSISEGMEAIERFFREAPVDYDDKCNLWIDFLSKLKDNK